MNSRLILVVEDDLELRQVICRYLTSEGFSTIEADDGQQAVALWEEKNPDLIVLDWMIPAKSGLDVTKEVRAKADVPIIMMTAKSEEPDIILGLEIGADDYLTKPVSPRQLVARIRAVLRRARPDENSMGPQTIRLGDLVIDPVAHTVQRNGDEVALTATEYKILLALAESPKRVFSRLQLMEAATGDYFEGYERFGAAWPWLVANGYPQFWLFRAAFVDLVVASGTGFFVARRITGRLSRLGDAVQRLDLRDLSLRVPVEGDDEVAAVARAFNLTIERLEAEERSRRQLFADVAHELRHPLAVLRARLESMQDGVVPTNSEQVLYLQDQVIALARLVSDLRDLSLAEVGGLSLDLASLDIKELIEDVQENMDPVAQEKGVTLQVDLDPNLPAVKADTDRIRQVIVNLVSNALHYTASGGLVGVRAWSDKEDLFIEVADTGPGIAREDLPHIFDRFYRADRARTRKTGGSGLGLAIVRSLVELHGGSIQVTSTEGKGTCFTVRLPTEFEVL